eukprot:scaffold55908_cov32-Tisochrysis_lutea.AAC.3
MQNAQAPGPRDHGGRQDRRNKAIRPSSHTSPTGEGQHARDKPKQRRKGQRTVVVVFRPFFWHEYFGIGTSFLRYILSSMFVVVAQGVQIRMLPGLNTWFADFRFEIRGVEFFIFTVTVIVNAFKVRNAGSRAGPFAFRSPHYIFWPKSSGLGLAAASVPTYDDLSCKHARDLHLHFFGGRISRSRLPPSLGPGGNIPKTEKLAQIFREDIPFISWEAT